MGFLRLEINLILQLSNLVLAIELFASLIRRGGQPSRPYN